MLVSGQSQEISFTLLKKIGLLKKLSFISRSLFSKNSHFLLTPLLETLDSKGFRQLRLPCHHSY
jgi:hypothetical protein